MPARGTRTGYGLPVDWAEAGSLWTETQLKRISKNHQLVWGHDHECVRAEEKWTLLEDHNSFEMWKMMVRTEQLLHIAEATGSRIHARESEAETDCRVRNLVLSLKQKHTHYYRFYKNGTMRAMVGLQGLYTSDAFRQFNMSSSVRLKSFCPWCFKLGGNTDTIATHLWEVHYRLAIVCDVCKVFASM